MPKIVINNTVKTAISILVISNHDSFGVLFDKIASICFIRKKGIYILALKMASPGNQHCASCIGTLSFLVVMNAPVYVCSRAYRQNHVSNLYQILFVCFVRCSVFLWRRSDTLYTSGVLDDVICCYNGPCESCPYRCSDAAAALRAG